MPSDACFSTMAGMGRGKSRSRKSAQDDKWSFCLTAGTLWPANQERPCRDDHAGTTHRHSKLRWHSQPSRAIGRWPQLAEQFDVHPNQITSWKAQLESGAADVFGSGGGTAAQPAVDVKSLHAKIGELTLENDFLEGALTKAGLLSAKR